MSIRFKGCVCFALVGILYSVSAYAGGGGELTIQLPEGVKPESASAAGPVTKVEGAAGKGKQVRLAGPNATVSGQTIKFTGFPPETPFDITIKLADGTVLEGVSPDWYSEWEPAKPNAGPMTDNDRECVRAIVQDIQDFYNKKDILYLVGDHDRAIAIVRLVRDTGFYSSKNGEMIWRIELWYFKFQHGGWEKVLQQNHVVHRERFKTQEAFHAMADKLKFIPALGGLTFPKDKAVELKLTAKELNPEPPSFKPKPKAEEEEHN